MRERSTFWSAAGRTRACDSACASRATATGTWTTSMHSSMNARSSSTRRDMGRSSAASRTRTSRSCSIRDDLDMETALTPLEFARRARKLYGGREAVVDGDLRLTYEQFFDRCDRWSAALQGMGVKKGDRVAYISPNTHEQLESFYAVPQIGAVLVPVNFRLTPDDFAYIINHCGARVVCAHEDYLEAVDGIRDQLTRVRHYVALEGARPDWLEYERLVKAASPRFRQPTIRERDLLTINYTSGTTSRPKGVMITHRNAYMNVVGTLIHLPMTPADRYLWTLPMFHANGWTYVWIVTAVGAVHVCLRRVDPTQAFQPMASESITSLCAAPTVLISLANAPDELRKQAPKGVRVVTAGA